MNKLYNNVKNDILKDKGLVYALIITIVLSVIFGVIFITIIKGSDLDLVTSKIEEYFTQIKENNIDILKYIKNVITTNNIYLTIIWLLGISIIGIPLIIFLLFFKGFSLGFTISSIILKYKFNGVLISFFYVFPHLIINIMTYFMMSYYALKFSLNIFGSLIKRKELNIKTFINKYIIILIISIILVLISALIETFISPYLLRLVLNL